jgi:CRP-like cAMP-binding protein
MADSQTATPNATPDDGLLDRLAAHRAFASVPREELAWLAAHGTLERYEPGSMIARKGEPVEALYVILSGHVSHLTDQGGTWRKAMDWRGGDVTGILPYSRLSNAPGNSVIQETTELLRVERVYLPAIPIECPHVTAALAEFMAQGVNRYINLWQPSPAMVQIEQNVVRWLCDLFDYPDAARGLLTSGGSMANFSAIVTARHAKLGEDFLDGTYYVSEQVHASVSKAAFLIE